MLRTAAVLLLLCACTARPSDDGDVADESSGEGSTTGDITNPTSGSSLDDSTGPMSTSTSATTTDATDTAADTTTDTVTTGDPNLSFELDIQPILDEHCVAQCHEPDGEWGFLLDMSGSAYDDLVGVTAPQHFTMSLIEPGDPDNSYLWHKINGTQAAAGGSGLMMPKARPGMQSTVLTLGQLETIQQWVLAGAPE